MATDTDGKTDADRVAAPKTPEKSAKTPATQAAPEDDSLAGDEEEDDEADASDALDKFDQQLFDRERKLRLQTAELAVKDAEDKLRAKEQQRRKEARDEREAILKAVRVSTPDLSGKLVDKMDELSIAKHDFAKRADTTLFDTAGVKLSTPQEFFDLSPAQREDLLDRVGFYRGLIIDHGQTNVIQPSFLDVLEREPAVLPPATGFGSDLSLASPAPPADAPKAENTVAKALYRKPSYAGFFENSFTSSEAVHQSQKNGVTNLKFSLAVAGGVGTKVGLGVGVGYNEQTQTNDGGVRKKVYITSNFYLPKIELSFDSRAVCASKGFIQSVRDALGSTTDLDGKFAALKGVLDAYGHFACTSTLIGGRLFATETKDFVGAETGSDVTKRFAAEVKGMVSGPTVTAEMQASAERSTQVKEKAKSTDEQQSMTFHAVGGEGGVVKDASAWITSLFDYRRWSAVQRENLIPTIKLLPRELSAACWELLESYAKTRTKRALLFDENAYFLFYGEYGERVGSLASETWFMARNPAYGAVLTVSDTRPTDGSPVSLQPAVPLEGQIWRMTPDGHLVSRAKRAAGAYGKRDDVEFALTVVGSPPAAGSKDGTAVVQMRQLGRAPHQSWEYQGGGQFVSLSFGADYVLAAEGADKLVVQPRAAIASAGQTWDLSELTGAAAVGGTTTVAAASLPAGGAASSSSPAAARRVGITPDPDVWFKLRSADTRMVVTARNGEGRAGFQRGERVLAIMEPDIGDYHQYWRMTEDGRIISRLSLLDGSYAEDLYLSMGAEDAPLTLSPDTPNLKQRWTLTTEGYLAPIGARSQSVVTAGDTENQRLQGTSLVLRPRNSERRQLWTIDQVGIDPPRAPYGELTTVGSGETGGNKLYMVDGRSLPVDGQITGAYLRWFERGGIGTGKCLQLRVQVRQADGSLQMREHDDNPDSDDYSYIDQSDAFADTKFLYLPKGPIAALRFGFKPGGKVLALMYKINPADDWVYALGDDKETLTTDLRAQSCTGGSFQVGGAEQAVAIGLCQPPGSRMLGLRMLIGPRPGFLPSGAVMQPGESLASPNGHWALKFDDQRRVIIAGHGEENLLWEPTHDMTPAVSWRLLVGAGALHVFDASAAIQRIDAEARDGKSVLAMQDDGNLVFYRLEGTRENQSLNPTSASQSETLEVKAHVK